MEHETLLIQEFIIKNRRERYINLIATPKGRIKLRKYIAHFTDFDLSYLVEVNHLQTPEELIKLLSINSSNDLCYIISEHDNYDMKLMPLKKTVNSLFQSGVSYFISCIPGKLVYYEGEGFNNKFLLQK